MSYQASNPGPPKSLGIQPEEAGDECGTQRRRLGGLGQGAQHERDLSGFLGEQHASIAAELAPEAHQTQRLLHPVGLLVGARQYGKITGAERPPVESSPALHDSGHLTGHQPRQLGACPAGLGDLPASASPSLAGHPEDIEGRRDTGELQPIAAIRTRLYRQIADFVQQERLRRAAEQNIDRLDQPWVRSVVGAQGMALGRTVPGSLKVGEDVGSAERVDRLLRVADHEQGRPAVCEHSAEDLVLNRIGVLEFVDQRR